MAALITAADLGIDTNTDQGLCRLGKFLHAMEASSMEWKDDSLLHADLSLGLSGVRLRPGYRRS